jgi:uncharacterized protein (TIGR03067 family)
MNLCCFLVAGLLPVLKCEAQRKQLQGTWQAVTRVADCREDSPDMLQYVRHTYKACQVTNTKAFCINQIPQGQGGEVVSDFVLDTSRWPYAIHFTAIRVDGCDVPKKWRRTLSVIYAVRGDLLIVCANPDPLSDDFPETIDAAPGVVLIDFKRVK